MESLTDFCQRTMDNQDCHHTSEISRFRYVNMCIRDGVLVMTYLPELIIDMTVAQAIVEDRKILADGRVYPMILDASEMHFIFTDARKFLASPPALEGISAQAIFSHNPMSALVSRFSILFDEPGIPVRVFEKTLPALDWIFTFK